MHKFKFLVYICKIYTLCNDFCINIEEEIVFGVVKIGDYRILGESVYLYIPPSLVS